MAVLILELFGQLPGYNQERWTEIFLAHQDPKTGLFLDPQIDAKDLKPGGPGVEYLNYQTTYFVLHALDALRAAPNYPLGFIQSYLDIGSLEKWLENLDWTKPWLSSNWIMFLVNGIILHGINSTSDDHLGVITGILNWLDAHQDPQTGYWGSQAGVPIEHAMAATYHFLPFYLWAGRRFQFAERIIESTLLLQGEDGLFHTSQGGDSCLDVDALDILIKCRILTDHRHAEVGMAVDRIFQGLVDNQDEAGGFVEPVFDQSLRKVENENW